MTETISVGVRLPKKFLEYIDREAERESVDRSVILRRLVEKGAEELEKEKAAKQYMEGKTSLSGAAENAKLTIPEMVDYLVSKGYKSDYSIDDSHEGITLLKGKLKAGKTDS